MHYMAHLWPPLEGGKYTNSRLHIVRFLPTFDTILCLLVG